MRLWHDKDRSDALVPCGSEWGAGIGLVSAVLAFFAVLVLALSLAAGRLAANWGNALAEAGTLRIVAQEDAVEAQARAALDVLRSTPGIQSVRIIDVAEQRALLGPWLGAGLAIDSLPLPLLIEVVSDRTRLDRADLALRLSVEAPGAVFDDHAGWRRPLVLTAERLRIFALLCLGLLALAFATVMSLAAKAATLASGQVIQTLRLIGARDAFISRGFTQPFTRQATAGALAGTGLGTVLLAFLPQASEPGFFLVGIGARGWQLMVPCLVPAIAGLVAWLATRAAARRGLRRWS